MSRSCATCRLSHKNNDTGKDCVKRCYADNYDKWEPVETKQVTNTNLKGKEVARSCLTCKRGDDTCAFFKANDCHCGTYQKWEPKETFTKRHCRDCDYGMYGGSRCSNNQRLCEDFSEFKPKVTNTNSIKESSMKTQQIFAVVVTENEKIKDDTGQVESIKKRVIYSAIDVPAFDEANANNKAMAKAIEAGAIQDIDEVEVKVSPFPAS